MQNIQIAPLKVTTPIGTAKYPHLTSPDTKFNADGEYRIELVLEAGEAAEELWSQASAFRDKAVSEYKKLSGGKAVKVSQHFPITRNEDGTLSVKAKMKAKISTKSGRTWDQRPALFDAKGTPVKSEIRIGSGSSLRLSIELHPFNQPAIGGAGLSARLRGVQIISVREPNSNSASDFGFGAEETGFVVETFDGFEEDSEKAKPTSGKVDF
jgi:hypothetical protein